MELHMLTVSCCFRRSGPFSGYTKLPEGAVGECIHFHLHLFIIFMTECGGGSSY
jgi:hypothetical protein